MIQMMGKKDLNEIFDRVMGDLLYCPQESVDLTRSPSIYSYDNLLKAESCQFSFDLAHIGLTKNRWARFLTQYVNKKELERWLQSVGDQRGTIVNLLRSTGETDVVPSLYHLGEKGHRWGVCFLGVSFSKSPKPKLTLYSRTARMPTTAVMELTLVHHLAEEIQKRYEIKTPIKFTWFCAAIHVTAWDVLPYLIVNGTLEDFLQRGVPFSRFVAHQYEKSMRLKPTRVEIPYTRQRRITKRVQQFKAGVFLPSCLIKNLSLWKGRS